MTAPRDQSIDYTMSFGDHLEELRKRVLLALIFPIPAAIVLYCFSITLVEWLLLPLSQALTENHLAPVLVNLTPQEMILTRIKLSFIFALIISAPWVLWQAWRFIAPGLYLHERRFVHLLLPGSAILTVIGLILMYFVLLPITLNVLVSLSQGVEFPASNEPIDQRVADTLDKPVTLTVVTQMPEAPKPGEAFIVWPDFGKGFIAVAGEHGGVELVSLPLLKGTTVAQQYRVSETISFILLMFLGIAVAFQMPLVVLLLGWVGLASVQWLRARRKYALFICGVLAAIITPSADLISMLVMMIPLYGLYELGIVLLMLAPASAVAEGRVVRWNRTGTKTSDNRREPMDRSRHAAQAELTVARSEGSEHGRLKVADGGEDLP